MVEPDPVAPAVESALTPTVAEAAAEVTAWAQAMAARTVNGWDFTSVGPGPDFPRLRLRSLRVLTEHAATPGEPDDGGVFRPDEEPEEPHRLTVRLIPHRDLAGVDQGPQPHRELQHTAACDALKYGQRCPFDDFEGSGGVDDFPAEPGEYEGWYWASKSWGASGWEYDAGIEWQQAGDAVARETAEQTPHSEGAWTCACRYMNSGPICTHCGGLKPGTETATVTGPASPGDLP